jgi:hypothetical protein
MLHPFMTAELVRQRRAALGDADLHASRMSWRARYNIGRLADVSPPPRPQAGTAVTTNSSAARPSRRGLRACTAEWKLLCGTHNLVKLWRHQTAQPLATPATT